MVEISVNREFEAEGTAPRFATRNRRDLYMITVVLKGAGPYLIPWPKSNRICSTGYYHVLFLRNFYVEIEHLSGRSWEVAAGSSATLLPGRNRICGNTVLALCPTVSSFHKHRPILQ